MICRLRWPLGLAALVAAAVVALTAIAARRVPASHLPSFAAVRAEYLPSDARLLDRHGEVIHELRVDTTRRRFEWTTLADVSPALQAAVIASEDRRFYHHHGVDWSALLAAVAQRALGRPLRGASTISMQVVTALDPSLRRHGGPRTLAQKWRQMRLAWALEHAWSKAEVFEAYLNLVTFRGELQGVAAAAAVLFDKSPHGITEPEALILAVLVRAPNAAPATVAQRACVLRAALPAAHRDCDDLGATVAQALHAPAGTGPRVVLAPHVAHQLLRPAATREPVRSTLDAALQRVATDALRRNLLAVRQRRVQDGAVLVVDNADGDVLAYVGSSSELSSARYVDGVRARRQAGSTLKPFLYGMALDRRLLTPASILADTPLELSVAGGLYRPRDYDEQFHGLVTLRTALAASLNVPAVRTLQLVGVDAFAAQLRRLGFAGLAEAGDYYGPPLALGSGDVSLWELTNAYRALANGGVWRPLRLTPTEPARDAEQRVYSAGAAFLLSDMLADRDSRSVTFGLDNPLVTRFWSAVKTGTSKEMRDNWCVGYSQRYTVGVWVGNFSGEPMQDVSGITGAAPIWLEVMSWLHRDTPSAAPQPPPAVVGRRVAFPHPIEAPRREWFLAGTAPSEAAIALAAQRAAIIAPVTGTVVALDPDIPAAQQRVVFEATAGTNEHHWVLDGVAIGSGALLLWDPQPGTHTLALVGEDQRSLDVVTFVVKGTRARS